MTVVGLNELPSKVSSPTHRASWRLDPFWLDLWPQGSNGSWLSRTQAARREAAGVKCLTARDRRNDPSVSRRRMILGTLPEAMTSLAAIAMWRTMTSEQIAAVAGWVDPGVDPDDPRSARRWRDHPPPLRHLWAVGLVERGEFLAGGLGLPPLFRPSVEAGCEDFLAELGFTDRLAVTAGRSWSTGPRHDRHNLLSAELCLRIAEHCDVGTVLGEMVCNLVDMAVDPTDTAASDAAAADGCVVRTDGVRIALEVTASGSYRTLRSKIERWATLLCEDDFEVSGLMVCFVDASRPEVASLTTRPLRRAIRDVIDSRPEGASRRLRERMAVARWTTWFPGPDLVDVDFLTLAAELPGASSRLGSDQVVRHLLDPTDVVVDATTPATLRQVIAGSALLGGTPYVLRDQVTADHRDGGRWAERTYAALTAEAAGFGDLLSGGDLELSGRGANLVQYRNFGADSA